MNAGASPGPGEQRLPQPRLCAAGGSYGLCPLDPHGPNGGVADSLDAAKAAFRAAWERPLSEQQARGLMATSHSLDPERT